ncbi:MAG: non-ribosomal peptide synthetase, partial [Actinomycetota bacterium]
MLAEVFGLTPMQEGLAFHSALVGPGDPDVYTVQLVLALSGDVDVERLRGAFSVLLKRHPHLGASFVQVPSGPIAAVVYDDVSVPVSYHDASAQGLNEALATLDALAQADHAVGFELSRGPLIRVRLIKLAPRRYRLVITYHHILLDGWSTPLLLAELGSLYGSGGDETGLGQPPSFRDYLAWLGRQDPAGSEKAWQGALAGAEPTHLVAAEPHRALRRTPMMPERVEAVVPVELSACLSAVARKQGVTLNTVVQAAWGILLGRLTGSSDAVFGAVVSGRPPELPGAESMIGCFIATVPVRVRWKPAEPVSSLLGRLQLEQAKLGPHQHLGLSGIQRAAGLDDSFDTILVFENYPSPVRRDAAPAFQVFLVEARDATHYPISLVVAPGRTLRLRLDYRGDLFDIGAAEALLRRFLSVLSGIAADPEQRIGDIDILSGQERRRLLVELNQTAAQLPSGSLPELFEAQVRRTPGELAVVSDHEALTYADLNSQANALAHELIARGVGPESVVGILLDRSVGFVASLLAVLKSGAAYLPIDVGYPVERIATMLAAAEPALVLTSTAAQAVVDGQVHASCIVLDRPDTQISLAARPATDPGLADRGVLSRAHPVYVIFTSGSSGRPKGVVMPAEGLVNLVTWHQRALGGSIGTRTAHCSAASFDVAAEEILATLLHGKTLVIPTEDIRRSPWELASWLEQQSVEELFATNTLLQALAESANDQYRDLAPLTTVVQAGEPLTLTSPLRKLIAGRPELQLHNHCGPTETHTANAYRLPADLNQAAVEPPIGTPIANTQV